MSEKPVFVVMQFGHLQFWSWNEADALDSARESVEQHLIDHLGHKLPLEVTPELARQFDVRLYRCDSSSEVPLPFQQWADEFLQETQERTKNEEEEEFERFLELRERYEERFQRQRADSRFPSPPNCS